MRAIDGSNFWIALMSSASSSPHRSRMKACNASALCMKDSHACAITVRIPAFSSISSASTMREISSLAAAVGLPEPENGPAHRRVCVAGRGTERIAFETSEILGVRRVPLAGLNTPPVTVAKTPNALAKAVFSCDGHEVALLDEEKLFSRLFGSVA